MKRDTLYKMVIAVMIALNLLQISYHFYSNNKKNPKVHTHKPDAVSYFKLDNEQQQFFKKSGELHGQSITKLQLKHKKIVSDYFQNPSDSLLNLVKEIEAEKIIVTEKHFEEMKSALRDDQLLAFKEFKKRTLNHIIR